MTKTPAPAFEAALINFYRAKCIQYRTELVLDGVRDQADRDEMTARAAGATDSDITEMVDTALNYVTVTK